MKKKILLLLAPLFSAVLLQAQDLKELESKRIRLPNGWSLTPAGKSLPLGDLPLNIVISKNHRFAAVTNNGQSTQTIQLLDAKNDRQLDQIKIERAWGGLAFSGDEKYLYASGGDDNWILRYSIVDNKLVPSDTLRLGPSVTVKGSLPISPTGITVDDKKGVLYVVTKQDCRLYVIDLRTRKIVNKVALRSSAYACVLSPDRNKLYISIWGDARVEIFDVKKQVISDSIVVGDNPNDLCLSKNGRTLFVANSKDNTVSVIDLKKNAVLETLNTAVFPTSLSGTTSNSVALSEGDKTLYIANADNNCLAVFDVSHPGKSHSLGFIPTGWYPSVVRVFDNKLYVANAKGFSSLPNPHGPNPVSKEEMVILHGYRTNHEVQYIGGGLLMGTLSIIPAPNEKALQAYSLAVYKNTPYHNDEELHVSGEEGNPIPRNVGDSSPVKYVFYIIKENRTYDQVLGDMPAGNGDTSLVLFGRKITPNQHALAEEFVLLDNFYVDGEVSADGHMWSLGAYATDMTEKNWPTSYGGHGYGSAGSRSAYNKVYIWDRAISSNINYRVYGTWSSWRKYPLERQCNHPNFRKDADTGRFSAWKNEFDSLLLQNAVPRLNIMHLGNDHTFGTAAGKPTPYACVADNDLALGLIVEHLSKSPIWKQTAVFVVEDDAQNGPDHVDAHRTTAYVAGGFVKRGYVDHSMYSTSSMLRTIELILGMPPMTQYDAAARPMWRCFDKTPDLRPFKSLPSNIDLSEVNPDGTRLGALAKGLDFSEVDKVPDAIMNEMVWKAIRGEQAKVPTPVRAAFIRQSNKEKDGDE